MTHMKDNGILELPLGNVLRTEIALTLSQMQNLITIGQFLQAWRNVKQRKEIEQIFDNATQARHAAATFGHWMGAVSPASVQSSVQSVAGWWPIDEQAFSVPVISTESAITIALPRTDSTAL